MIDFDPVSAYTKNDPDLYVRIHKASNKLEIVKIDHVRGHQDRIGQELNLVEKLNVLADQLATKATSESEAAELEWNPEIGPILKIAGHPVTNKEGMFLSIAAEGWIRIVAVTKAQIKRSEYTKIDWESQHKTMAAYNQNSNRFAI